MFSPLRRLCYGIAVVLLFGCTPVHKPVETQPLAPVTKADPADQKKAPVALIEPAEQKTPPADMTDIVDKPPLQVAVVLSGNIDVYNHLAEDLSKQLDGRVQKFLLNGDKKHDAKIVDTIQKSEHDQVVAVGLRAARAVSILQQKKIVFSYVFNYRDHNLVKTNTKGVSALPGAEAMFRDWKLISPTTRKVAVITGPNLDDYISHAVRAARDQKIELVHIIVNTDKEFLYQTKNIASDIQGQWIIPDNRVLSRKTLKEALTYNSKEGKQTVVFSPSLLKLGGLFYSRTSAIEVSGKIFKRLLDSQHREDVPGQPVEFLESHEIGINPVVAKQLGLTIPAAYKKYLDE